MSHTYDMTTYDRSITEQLPDLPALESAEARASARTLVMVLCVVYVGFIVGSCTYGYWILREFLGEQSGLATGIMAFLILSWLWVILRLLSGVFSWKTDSHGLTMRGPLHRRFVAWQDVEDAESDQGASSLCYRLRTNGGVVRVNVEGGYESPSVYASIWQHLRRFGRADSLDLPEKALTFWDQIPGELPNAIEWTNPRPPKLWATVVPILAMGGFLVFAGLVLFQGGNWFGKGVMVIVAAGFLLFVRPVLRDVSRTAQSVSVSDDHIEVQAARGAFILPWSEVTSARWVQNASHGYSDLLITGRNPSDRVSIPHVTSSDESGRLILAIIRRLRTAGVPQVLTIPEELRAQTGPARVGPGESMPTEPAEVRLTVRERMLIMLLPIFIAFSLVFGKGGIRPISLAVPVGVGLLVLVWFASGTYALRADSDGIRKRFLGFGTLIRWDDVAEYSICPVFKRAVRNHRVLKNSNGKILTELSLNFGSRKARDRFWSLLDARLSQSWVSTKPAEQWKSRPWMPS